MHPITRYLTTILTDEAEDRQKRIASIQMQSEMSERRYFLL